MKILLSWLNEYGDFGDPADAAAVERVSESLTSLGLEVESVDSVGDIVQGVITAQRAVETLTTQHACQQAHRRTGITHIQISHGRLQTFHACTMND